MAKSQLLLLSFALLACFSHASGVFEVPIERDDKGLYLKTDLFPGPVTLTEGKFLLGFSHTEVIVASWCIFFNIHHCSEYNNDYNYCQNRDRESETSVQHHLFSAKGNYYNLPMYVNNTLWAHSKNTILTTSCKSPNTFYGHSREGVIGMATRNKYDHQVFSIFLNKNLTAGKLILGVDYSLTKTKYPMIFSANSTWQIDIYNGTFRLGSAMIPIKGNLMFDPTADTIALPRDIYFAFMSWFKWEHNVDCWGGRGEHKDICYYSGDISKLKPMILTINGQIIEIPGNIYAKQDSGRRGEIELNVRATDPSLHSDCYIDPAFKDSIILDANFMSQYYTVFTQKGYDHTIELNIADHPQDSDSSFSKKVKDFWGSLW